MPEIYKLTAGDGALALVNQRGAALVGLTLGGVAVMPDCASDAAQAFFAGSTLAPWPNRMARGEWQHRGQTLQHKANDGLGNANHGLVFDREFTATRQSAHELTLSLSISGAAAAVYPFEVEVQVDYQLRRDSLAVRLSATNLGDEPAPFAMGSHPYFAAPEGTTLTLNSKQVGLDSLEMIPTRRGQIAELGITAGQASLVTDLALDHEFSGFDDTALTTLSLPSGHQVVIRQDVELGYQMVFVANQFPWDAGVDRAIAIEPQSAAIDSFNNGLGLRTLAPRESWAAGWTVSVER